MPEFYRPGTEAPAESDGRTAAVTGREGLHEAAANLARVTNSMAAGENARASFVVARPDTRSPAAAWRRDPPPTNQQTARPAGLRKPLQGLTPLGPSRCRFSAWSGTCTSGSGWHSDNGTAIAGDASCSFR
jgi:hypothetical protein